MLACIISSACYALWFTLGTALQEIPKTTLNTTIECICLVLDHFSLSYAILQLNVLGTLRCTPTRLQEMLSIEWSPNDASDDNPVALAGSTVRPSKDASHLTIPFWSALLFKAIWPFTFGLLVMVSAGEGSGDSCLPLSLSCICFPGVHSWNLSGKCVGWENSVMSEELGYRSESRLIFGNSRSSEFSSCSTFTCTYERASLN